MHLRTFLFGCLSVYLSAGCLSVCLSDYLSIRGTLCLSVSASRVVHLPLVSAFLVCLLAIASIHQELLHTIVAEHHLPETLRSNVIARTRKLEAYIVNIISVSYTWYSGRGCARTTLEACYGRLNEALHLSGPTPHPTSDFESTLA